MSSNPESLPSESANAPIWNCNLEEAPQAGAAKLDSFTVGSKYLLTCRGEPIAEWKAQPMIRFSKEEQQYSLYPLKVVTQSSDQIQLVVTGYRPGSYVGDDLILTDGTNTVKMSKIEWQVKSVLEGNTQAQMVPPFGPFQMGFPPWLYGLWIVLALIFLGFFWRQGRRYYSRKRLLEKLATNKTALSPFNEMNKGIRGLLRKLRPDQADSLNSFVYDLDQLFRLYLVRRLLVPALEWSDRAVMNEIKNRYKQVYKTTASDLRRLFNELRKTKSATTVSRVDAEQLMEMTRQIADRIEHQLAGGGSK